MGVPFLLQTDGWRYFSCANHSVDMATSTKPQRAGFFFFFCSLDVCCFRQNNGQRTEETRLTGQSFYRSNKPFDYKIVDACWKLSITDNAFTCFHQLGAWKPQNRNPQKTICKSEISFFLNCFSNMMQQANSINTHWYDSKRAVLNNYKPLSQAYTGMSPFWLELNNGLLKIIVYA